MRKHTPRPEGQQQPAAAAGEALEVDADAARDDDHEPIRRLVGPGHRRSGAEKLRLHPQ